MELTKKEKLAVIRAARKKEKKKKNPGLPSSAIKKSIPMINQTIIILSIACLSHIKTLYNSKQKQKKSN